MNVSKLIYTILLIAVICGGVYLFYTHFMKKAPKPEAPAPEITQEVPAEPAAPVAKGVIEIKSEEELNNIIKTGNVIVDFHGEAWCGPCQQLAPVYKKVAEDTPNITFVKVNVDEVKRTDLHGVPTLVFFKEGKELDRKTGALDDATLRELIKKTFGL